MASNGSGGRNQLHFGDNLDVLRRDVATASVDLIYLDPPFNSSANYNMLFREPAGTRSQAQIEAFDDTWTWGHEAEAAFDDVLSGDNQRLGKLLNALRDALGDNSLMAYLAMMSVRLVEMHRALKPTGALYLHCDPTASHYLKIVLDAVFDPTNFLNEIIWRRTGSHNSAKRFGPIHDVILFYRRSEKYRHRPQFRPYMKGHVDGYFKKSDDRGHYWTNSIHGAGVRRGASGTPWRGYSPTSKGRHWAIPAALVEALGIDPDLPQHDKLDAMAGLGVIDFPDPASGGLPTYRQYLETSPGTLLQDIWAYQPHTRGTLYNTTEAIDEDVRWLSAQGDPERLGYPTQKPIGLLSRIIESSCPEDGVVLDPFCGCGTTIHAAQRLKRRWIGIDITHLAITLIESRIVMAFPGVEYDLFGTPKDLSGAEDLARRNKHQFELWALSLIKASPINNGKKGADKGIDGVLWLRVGASRRMSMMVSVKGGRNLDASMVRDLVGVVTREKVAGAVFLTLYDPTGPMKVEAIKAGFFEVDGERYPRIQIMTVKDLLDHRKLDLPMIEAAARRPNVDRQTTSQHALF